MISPVGPLVVLRIQRWLYGLSPDPALRTCLYAYTGLNPPSLIDRPERAAFSSGRTVLVSLSKALEPSFASSLFSLLLRLFLCPF